MPYTPPAGLLSSIMLFLNVLLFCLVRIIPVLAAVIPQGDLQIRSPGSQPDLHTWRILKGVSLGIEGTWYLSPEGDPANVIWARYVIELDLNQWPPIVYELTNDPGVLKLSPTKFASNWLSLATWRRKPYRKGSNANDKLNYSIHRGFKLSCGRLAPETLPPVSVSEQIRSYLLLAPGHIEHLTEHADSLSGFWYGIEDHNRNIIMEINNGLSLIFYKLPDGAEKMEIIAEDDKNRGLGAWRLMPLQQQAAATRNHELIVRMQNDVLYFDRFEDHR